MNVNIRAVIKITIPSDNGFIDNNMAEDIVNIAEVIIIKVYIL